METMSKVTETTTQPQLIEFVNSLPPPLTTALVGLAPTIARIRRLAQVLSWRSSWEESCLALAVWWAVCLLAEIGLRCVVCHSFYHTPANHPVHTRYFLPFILLLGFAIARWRARLYVGPPLVTEDSLQQTISDLTTLHALLPTFAPVTSSPSRTALLRVVAILYVPCLLFTHLVRLRVLLAIAGTVVLTWRARWAVLTRRALWRSAHVRWATYRLWAALSGQHLPPKIAISASTDPDISAASASSTSVPPDGSPPAPEVRFLFTVYENQRWWVGLDWTAALLPSERPAWCAPTLAPTAPPVAFALPAPTTVYLPANPGSGNGKKGTGSRMKRTARWRWAEPEWRVVVHREGEPVSRVERTPPREEAGGASAASSAARVLRAAGKMREGSIGGSPERHVQRDRERNSDKEDGDSRGDEEGEEIFTDPDGWVYADNKWEGPSARGGMGKVREPVCFFWLC